jgi:hypothetical protein
LSHGVMVAHLILVQPVEVRVLVGQQYKNVSICKCDGYVFLIPKNEQYPNN